MRNFVLLAEKLGADESEVCRLSGSSFSVSKEGADVETKEFSASEGYAIRVLKDRRVGFSYFAKGGDAEGGIKRALALSKFSHESGFHFPSSFDYREVETFDKRVESLSEEEGVRMLKQGTESVKKPAEAAKAGLDYGSSRMEIENSAGLSISRRSTYISCFFHCTHGKSSGSSFRDSRFLDFEPSGIGKEASERAIEAAEAKPLKTGPMAAVFEAEALSSLFYSLLLPSFHGERAHRKVSVLHDKLGGKISSEELTLTDDPLFRGPGSSSFDGEGSPCKPKNLIRNGVVSNFLFDLKTAALARDSLSPSSGNCRRSSYGSEPGIGSSNLVVENGNEKDALEICGKGILVCSVFGEHTANDLTGEFSVSVDRGFEIRGGKKGKPVRGNVISGNVFELVKGITAIEKKQERVGSFVSPRIAFEGIQLVGK